MLQNEVGADLATFATYWVTRKNKRGETSERFYKF